MADLRAFIEAIMRARQPEPGPAEWAISARQPSPEEELAAIVAQRRAEAMAPLQGQMPPRVPFGEALEESMVAAREVGRSLVPFANAETPAQYGLELAGIIPPFRVTKGGMRLVAVAKKALESGKMTPQQLETMIESAHPVGWKNYLQETLGPYRQLDDPSVRAAGTAAFLGEQRKKLKDIAAVPATSPPVGREQAIADRARELAAEGEKLISPGYRDVTAKQAADLGPEYAATQEAIDFYKAKQARGESLTDKELSHLAELVGRRILIRDKAKDLPDAAFGTAAAAEDITRHNYRDVPGAKPQLVTRGNEIWRQWELGELPDGNLIDEINSASNEYRDVLRRLAALRGVDLRGTEVAKVLHKRWPRKKSSKASKEEPE